MVEEKAEPQICIGFSARSIYEYICQGYIRIKYDYIYTSMGILLML